MRHLSIFSLEHGGLVQAPLQILQARLLADYLSFFLIGHYPVVEDVLRIVQACSIGAYHMEQGRGTAYERWKGWIDQESRNRLAWGHILLGCLATTNLVVAPTPLQTALASNIYKMVTPSREDQWNTASSSAWQKEHELSSGGRTEKLSPRSESARTTSDMEPFPASVACLALDVLAGDEVKARRRTIRRDEHAGVTSQENALWTLVDLQDELLKIDICATARRERKISSPAINALLIRQLGCISLQIPLLLLRSFARREERAEGETLELIRLCVMKDGSARGRRMLLAGAQAWAILEKMSATEMNEAVITPFVLFYATCAIYLYAYMLRLANEGAWSGESEERIPANAERIYLDRISSDSKEVDDWLKGKVRYLPCLLGESFSRGGGSLLRKETLQDLVDECARRLRQLNFMHIHCEGLYNDLYQLPA